MRERFVALALAALAGFFCAQARAQTYPSRQITLIVPFPPGGSTDVAARILAERMRAPLGQPVIIENVGGAGGRLRREGIELLQSLSQAAAAALPSPDFRTVQRGHWKSAAAKASSRLRQNHCLQG
jgi:hypothetical protein